MTIRNSTWFSFHSSLSFLSLLSKHSQQPIIFFSEWFLLTLEKDVAREVEHILVECTEISGRRRSLQRTQDGKDQEEHQQCCPNLRMRGIRDNALTMLNIFYSRALSWNLRSVTSTSSRFLFIETSRRGNNVTWTRPVCALVPCSRMRTRKTKKKPLKNS